MEERNGRIQISGQVDNQLQTALANLTSPLRNIIQIQYQLNRTTDVTKNTIRSLNQALATGNHSSNSYARATSNLAKNQAILSAYFKQTKLASDQLNRSLQSNTGLTRSQTTAVQNYNKQLKAQQAIQKDLMKYSLKNDMRDQSMALNSLATRYSYAGNRLSMGLTAPLALFFRSAFANYRRLEVETIRTEKLLDDAFGENTQSKVAELGKQLDKVSLRYGVARELIQGLAGDYAELGITNTDTLAGLTEMTAQIEKLGNVDIEQSQTFIRSVYQTINRVKRDLAAKSNEPLYSDAAGEAKYYSDVIAELRGQLAIFNQVENKTSLSLKEIAKGFPELTAAATSFGLSMTEASSLLVPMVGAGFQLGASANSVKVSLQRLVAMTEKNHKMIKTLKASYKDFNVEAGVGVETIQNLADAYNSMKMGELGEAGTLEFFSELFGVRQGPRMEVAIQNLAQFQDQISKQGTIENQLSGKLQEYIRMQALKGGLGAEYANMQITKFSDFSKVVRLSQSSDKKVANAFSGARTDLSKFLTSEAEKNRDLIGKVTTESGKAMIIGLAGGGSDTQSAKTYEKELGKSLNTAENRYQQARESIKSLGREMVPVLADILKFLVPILQKVTEFVQNKIPSSVKKVAAIGLILLAMTGPALKLFGAIRQMQSGFIGLKAAGFGFGRVKSQITPIAEELLVASDAMFRFKNKLTEVNGRFFFKGTTKELKQLQKLMTAEASGRTKVADRLSKKLKLSSTADYSGITPEAEQRIRSTIDPSFVGGFRGINTGRNAANLPFTVQTAEIAGQRIGQTFLSILAAAGFDINVITAQARAARAATVGARTRATTGAAVPVPTKRVGGTTPPPPPPPPPGGGTPGGPPTPPPSGGGPRPSPRPSPAPTPTPAPAPAPAPTPTPVTFIPPTSPVLPMTPPPPVKPVVKPDFLTGGVEQVYGGIEDIAKYTKKQLIEMAKSLNIKKVGGLSLSSGALKTDSIRRAVIQAILAPRQAVEEAAEKLAIDTKKATKAAQTKAPPSDRIPKTLLDRSIPAPKITAPKPPEVSTRIPERLLDRSIPAPTVTPPPVLDVSLSKDFKRIGTTVVQNLLGRNTDLVNTVEQMDQNFINVAKSAKLNAQNAIDALKLKAIRGGRGKVTFEFGKSELISLANLMGIKLPEIFYQMGELFDAKGQKLRVSVNSLGKIIQTLRSASATSIPGLEGRQLLNFEQQLIKAFLPRGGKSGGKDFGFGEKSNEPFARAISSAVRRLLPTASGKVGKAIPLDQMTYDQATAGRRREAEGGPAPRKTATGKLLTPQQAAEVDVKNAERFATVAPLFDPNVLQKELGDAPSELAKSNRDIVRALFEGKEKTRALYATVRRELSTSAIVPKGIKVTKKDGTVIVKQLNELTEAQYNKHRAVINRGIKAAKERSLVLRELENAILQSGITETEATKIRDQVLATIKTKGKKAKPGASLDKIRQITADLAASSDVTTGREPGKTVELMPSGRIPTPTKILGPEGNIVYDAITRSKQRFEKLIRNIAQEAGLKVDEILNPEALENLIKQIPTPRVKSAQAQAIRKAFSDLQSAKNAQIASITVDAEQAKNDISKLGIGFVEKKIQDLQEKRKNIPKASTREGKTFYESQGKTKAEYTADLDERIAKAQKELDKLNAKAKKIEAQSIKDAEQKIKAVEREYEKQKALLEVEKQRLGIQNSLTGAKFAAVPLEERIQEQLKRSAQKRAEMARLAKGTLAGDIGIKGFSGLPQQKEIKAVPQIITQPTTRQTPVATEIDKAQAKVRQLEEVKRSILTLMKPTPGALVNPKIIEADIARVQKQFKLKELPKDLYDLFEAINKKIEEAQRALVNAKKKVAGGGSSGTVNLGLPGGINDPMASGNRATRGRQPLMGFGGFQSGVVANMTEIPEHLIRRAEAIRQGHTVLIDQLAAALSLPNNVLNGVKEQLAERATKVNAILYSPTNELVGNIDGVIKAIQQAVMAGDKGIDAVYKAIIDKRNEIYKLVKPSTKPVAAPKGPEDSDAVFARMQQLGLKIKSDGIKVSELMALTLKELQYLAAALYGAAEHTQSVEGATRKLTSSKEKAIEVIAKAVGANVIRDAEIAASKPSKTTKSGAFDPFAPPATTPPGTSRVRVSPDMGGVATPAPTPAGGRVKMAPEEIDNALKARARTYLAGYEGSITALSKFESLRAIVNLVKTFESTVSRTIATANPEYITAMSNELGTVIKDIPGLVELLLKKYNINIKEYKARLDAEIAKIAPPVTPPPSTAPAGGSRIRVSPDLKPALEPEATTPPGTSRIRVSPDLKPALEPAITKVVPNVQAEIDAARAVLGDYSIKFPRFFIKLKNALQQPLSWPSDVGLRNIMEYATTIQDTAELNNLLLKKYGINIEEYLERLRAELQRRIEEIRAQEKAAKTAVSTKPAVAATTPVKPVTDTSDLTRAERFKLYMDSGGKERIQNVLRQFKDVVNTTEKSVVDNFVQEWHALAMEIKRAGGRLGIELDRMGVNHKAMIDQANQKARELGMGPKPAPSTTEKPKRVPRSTPASTPTPTVTPTPAVVPTPTPAPAVTAKRAVAGVFDEGTMARITAEIKAQSEMLASISDKTLKQGFSFIKTMGKDAQFVSKALSEYGVDINLILQKYREEIIRRRNELIATTRGGTPATAPSVTPVPTPAPTPIPRPTPPTRPTPVIPTPVIPPSVTPASVMDDLIRQARIDAQLERSRQKRQQIAYRTNFGPQSVYSSLIQNVPAQPPIPKSTPQFQDIKIPLIFKTFVKQLKPIGTDAKTFIKTIGNIFTDGFSKIINDITVIPSRKAPNVINGFIRGVLNPFYMARPIMESLSVGISRTFTPDKIEKINNFMSKVSGAFGPSPIRQMFTQAKVEAMSLGDAIGLALAKAGKLSPKQLAKLNPSGTTDPSMVGTPIASPFQVFAQKYTSNILKGLLTAIKVGDKFNQTVLRIGKGITSTLIYSTVGIAKVSGNAVGLLLKSYATLGKATVKASSRLIGDIGKSLNVIQQIADNSGNTKASQFVKRLRRGAAIGSGNLVGSTSSQNFGSQMAQIDFANMNLARKLGALAGIITVGGAQFGATGIKLSTQFATSMLKMSMSMVPFGKQIYDVGARAASAVVSIRQLPQALQAAGAGSNRLVGALRMTKASLFGGSYMPVMAPGMTGPAQPVQKRGLFGGIKDRIVGNQQTGRKGLVGGMGAFAGGVKNTMMGGVGSAVSMLSYQFGMVGMIAGPILTNIIQKIAMIPKAGGPLIIMLMAVIGVFLLLKKTTESWSKYSNGALEKFKVAWSMIKQIIGMIISPVFDLFAAFTSGSNKAGGGFKTLGEKIGKFADKLLEILPKVKVFVAKYIEPAIRQIMSGVKLLIEALFPLFKAIWNFISIIINVFKGDFGKVWDSTKALFANLGKAIWKVLQGIIVMLAPIVKLIVSIFAAMVTTVVNLLEQIPIFFINALRWLAKGAIQLFFSGILQPVVFIYDSVLTIFANLLQGLIAIAKKIAQIYINTWFGIVKGALSAFGKLPFIGKFFDGLKDKVQGWQNSTLNGLNKLAGGATNAIDKLKRVGNSVGNMVQQSQDALMGGVDSVADWINAKIGSASNFVAAGRNAINSFIDGMVSNSMISKGIGKELKKGTKDAFKDPDAASAAGKLIGKAIDEAKNKIRGDFFNAALTQIGNAMSRIRSEITEKLNKQKDDALKAFDDQIAGIEALAEAEERLTATEEYEANRRKMIKDRELQQQNYRKERALAIYQGRIDDARNLDLEELKNAEESAKSIEDLDKGRNKELQSYNRQNAIKIIQNQKEAASKLFDEAIKEYEEYVDKVLENGTISQEQFTAQFKDIADKALTTSGSINTSFQTLFTQLPTTIQTGMDPLTADKGFYSTGLDKLITTAKTKFGLDTGNTTDNSGSLLGITGAMLNGQSSQITSAFGENGVIRLAYGSGIDGLNTYIKDKNNASNPNSLENIFKDAMARANTAVAQEIEKGKTGIGSAMDSLIKFMNKKMEGLAIAEAVKKAVAEAKEQAGNTSNSSSGGSGKGGTTYWVRARPGSADYINARLRIWTAIPASSADRYIKNDDYDFASTQDGNKPGFFKGGRMPYAKGGPTFGPMNQGIPATLHGGEFVLRKSAVDKYGLAMLSQMNKGIFVPQIPKINMPTTSLVKMSTLGGTQAMSSESTHNYNFYVDNFIGETEWFNSMMKEYNMKVVPANQKQAGIESRVIKTYNGINRGL